MIRRMCLSIDSVHFARLFSQIRKRVFYASINAHAHYAFYLMNKFPSKFHASSYKYENLNIFGKTSNEIKVVEKILMKCM